MNAPLGEAARVSIGLVHDQESQRVRENKGTVKPALGRLGVYAPAAHEHDRDPVILPGVVPRRPGQVGGKKECTDSGILDSPHKERDQCQSRPNRKERIGPALRTLLIDTNQGCPIVGR